MAPKKLTAAEKFSIGKKASQLWLEEEDFELIKKAADLEDRPMTVFIRRAAIKAALELLRQEGSKADEQ